MCDEGYQDNDDNGSCLETCEQAALDCGEHAQCEDRDGEARCVCHGGYQDHDGDGICRTGCATSGEICNGRGACEDLSGVAVCVCDVGYSGADCGVCAVGYQDHDGDGTCAFTCDFASVVCPEHMRCDDGTGLALCVCEPGHSGEDCRSCASGYQDADHDGDCLPDCSTSGPVCGGPGTCSDESGEADCVCDPGYQDHDDDGMCTIGCESNMLACGEGESCEDWHGAAQCACARGYAGPGCLACADGFELSAGTCRPDHAWTVLVYMSADNDLEDAAYVNLAQMAAVGSSDDVHMVVLLDTYLAGGRVVYVHTGGYVTVASLGEPDLGDWHVLREFGAWAVRTYPAERVALVLWDHGNGWSDTRSLGAPPAHRGFSEDVHGSAGPISIAGGELGRALAGIRAAQDGARLDVLGFDACLMGMWEVARSVAPHAEYLVASSENEPSSGWPYDAALAPLAVAPSTTPGAFAANVVEAYHAASAQHFTLGATDLQMLAGLDDEISALADALLAHPELFDDIDAVRSQTQAFANPAYRDLRDFSARLALIPNVPVDLEAAALAVSIGLEASVVHHLAQATHPGAHGLSVYLPPKGAGIDCAYLDKDAIWSASTSWDAFLIAFCSADCG